MKEAQRHGIARQHPMRAGIVERQHRLRAVTTYDFADSTINSVECLFPRDSREFVSALWANALQWVAHAVRAVDKIGIVIGHFGANGTVGNRIDLRAPHGDDLIACNSH